ncbi:hypothetical protein RHSIM_Rhsim08G0137100 [Rhododendron simsii]|uniref:Aminotransferase-like plant mobile domain-containing protein n=1 Tax=Rhododendron simsii TaxID=118357 RepID=A0A834GFU1_RHOSS|nr:hypothetical protein RHSIM_Rhsim08G0137100 [Rhododendron simsii]
MVRDDTGNSGGHAMDGDSIPPTDQWRRAPYLRFVNDPFWIAVGEYQPTGGVSSNLLLIAPETSIESADLVPPSSVLRLRVESLILEAVIISRDLALSRNDRSNENLEMVVSRWSVDTHTFVWAWGESGPSLEDAFTLMRLHPRGRRLLDLDNLSPDEAAVVQALRAAFIEAKKAGSRFKPDGTRRPPPNPRKASWRNWLRLFFKDFQPPKSVPAGSSPEYVAGMHYRQPLYLAGVLVDFLSNFILPDFLSESVSPFVFPLAACLAQGEAVALGPFFLGCLFNHFDRVHTDMERSLGRYDIISMIHSSFLLAFFFEHCPAIAPSPSTVPAQGRRRFWIERWSGASSRALLSSYCDRSAHFLPRPYTIQLEGMTNNDDFFLPMRMVLSTSGLAGDLARAVINSYCTSLPGWLPVLSAEGSRSTVYSADRIARQFGHDQATTSAAPMFQNFIECQGRFLHANLGSLVVGHENTILPAYDRAGAFTTGFHLSWRRNLDSFVQFVQGGAPELQPSVIQTQDMALRSPRARGHDWRGAHSQWAVTVADPISRVPMGLSAATAAGPSSTHAQEAGRTRRGRATRRATEEEDPLIEMTRPRKRIRMSEEEGDSYKETLAVGLRRSRRGAPATRPASFPTQQSVEVIEVEDSPATERVGEVTDIIQPPSQPRVHATLAEQSYVVVGGMLEFSPTFEDLHGGPSKVSSSSPSCADSPYTHSTPSDDPDRSPSQPAPSEEREETPSADTHESVGGVDVDMRTTTERLRDEEEDDLADLARQPRDHNGAEVSMTGNPRTDPITPGGQTDSSRTRPSAQVSAPARVPDVVVSEGQSNASTLQAASHSSNPDLIADATSPSARATSFIRHSIIGTSEPVSEPPVPISAQPPPAQSSQAHLEQGEHPGVEFTESELSYMIRVTGFLPGDDLLNGRGSEALGDFGRDSAGGAMAEESGHGEISTGAHSGQIQEEETHIEDMRDDAPPVIQTGTEGRPEDMDIAARNVGKQTIEEETVPTPREVIHHFPVGHVDEVYFSLVNSISLVHPETFANFRCRSLMAAGSFLVLLHDAVHDWNQTVVRTFTPAMQQELQALSLDLAQVQERIRVLTDRLESTRKQMADIEGELAEAQLDDLELAAGAPHEFNSDDSVFGGLLPP